MKGYFGENLQIHYRHLNNIEEPIESARHHINTIQRELNEGEKLGHRIADTTFPRIYTSLKHLKTCVKCYKTSSQNTDSVNVLDALTGEISEIEKSMELFNHGNLRPRNSHNNSRFREITSLRKSERHGLLSTLNERLESMKNQLEQLS